MGKARQELNRMIRELEDKITALRSDLDEVKSSHTEIVILIEITKLTEELARLNRFKTSLGGL